MNPANKLREISTTETTGIPVVVSDGALMGIGAVLVVLGMFSIFYATMSTLASVMMVGGLFLLGGAIETVSAIYYRQNGGMFFHLLSGILLAFAGIILLTRPATSAAGITLLMAACFVFGGLYRTIFAAVERWPAWGWSVASGLASVLLGILIFAQWPVSAFWVLGTFLGLELLLTGWALIAGAMELQRLSMKFRGETV